MSEYYERQMEMWRDLASELMEFIEYNLVLPPVKDRQYRDIIKKYNEEEE